MEATRHIHRPSLTWQWPQARFQQSQQCKQRSLGPSLLKPYERGGSRKDRLGPRRHPLPSSFASILRLPRPPAALVRGGVTRRPDTIPSLPHRPWTHRHSRARVRAPAAAAATVATRHNSMSSAIPDKAGRTLGYARNSQLIQADCGQR